MLRRTLNPSCLQRLAAQWSLLGQMLVAFARLVSRAETQGAVGDLRKAEWLEAALYAALVQLSADITAASKRPPKPGSKDAAALTHLKTVHALLGVLALLTRQLKANLRLLAERLAALNTLVVEQPFRAQWATLVHPEYLDSS